MSLAWPPALLNSGASKDEIDAQPNELGGDLGHALGAALRPAILDSDGATLDPTEFVHPIQESGDPLALDASCTRAEHPYRWQPCRLLRARRDRPNCRAAEQRDELAPFQSITSSARASSTASTSR